MVEIKHKQSEKDEEEEEGSEVEGEKEKDPWWKSCEAAIHAKLQVAFVVTPVDYMKIDYCIP